MRTAVVLFACAAGTLAAQQLTVVQEKAPMFKEPTISSPIIKYLEKDSRVNMLAVENSFYLVSYGGYEGWMIPYSVTGAEGLTGGAGTEPSGGAEQLARQIGSGRYLVVANEYANVREGPGLNYKRIGRVYKGDLLEKFIKRGQWYRVKLPDNRIAFIYEKLVAEPVLPMAAGTVSSAPGSGDAGGIDERIARLEREVESLRKALRETQAALLEMQRAGGAIRAGGLMGIGSSLLNQNAPTVYSGEGASQTIIGNTATKVYHLPGSVFYDKIPEEFRVIFRSKEQARQAGYVKSIN